VYLEYETFDISLVTLPYILLFLLGISELSDACDGYFARKYNQVTDLGKILDPMADSIYRISVFLTFTLPPRTTTYAIDFRFSLSRFSD
jgi:CDP-diacylglycerol--glycerol-3-phosphate 3-phosphatidyltransferase